MGSEERNGCADVALLEAEDLPQSAGLVAVSGDDEYIVDVTVVVGHPYLPFFSSNNWEELYGEARVR